jgi:hypothetical protein
VIDSSTKRIAINLYVPCVCTKAIKSVFKCQTTITYPKKYVMISPRVVLLMFLIIVLLFTDDIYAIWNNTRGAKDGWTRR